MNTLLYTTIFFLFPLSVFTGWLCYMLWYALNSNSGILMGLSWQEKLLIVLEV